ncbi:aminopeptidase P family N-terminal domain-containing protein, partial [Neptunomonas sp.]
MKMQMPQTLSIPNGEKVQPTFSKAELNARLEKLRRYMAENDMQAVLFTSYHNINYYSDFVYCRFGRDYGLVVTADSYTTVTANIDGGQPYRRNQLGDNVVYTDWQK